MSKRNHKVNPWITDGLTISINKKAELYEDWAKTKIKSHLMGIPNFMKNIVTTENPLNTP